MQQITDEDFIELTKYKNSKLQKKNYKRIYFQEKTKLIFRRCEICKIDIKQSSYSNHMFKSKTHKLNIAILCDSYEECDYCGWNCGLPQTHIDYCEGKCAYLKHKSKQNVKEPIQEIKRIIHPIYKDDHNGFCDEPIDNGILSQQSMDRARAQANYMCSLI
jgi:hypothetical protein